nr:N-acylglucosamine 2-epimerase isoform X5 [Taeniopygia guttata]
MEELRAWRGRIAAELDAAVAFWERHSHDPEHGGFFSCLSRDGSVYDDTKFVWLQGRQIWVYSRLYRTVPRFRRPELLQAARKAGEFLERHVRPEPGSSRAAFALRRDGRPERLQRSFYSEAFCALGLDELGRAAGEERYRAWARRWAGAVWGWARGAPMELGRPRFSGTPPPAGAGPGPDGAEGGAAALGGPPEGPPKSARPRGRGHGGVGGAARPDAPAAGVVPEALVAPRRGHGCPPGRPALPAPAQFGLPVPAAGPVHL